MRTLFAETAVTRKVWMATTVSLPVQVVCSWELVGAVRLCLLSSR